MPLNRPHPPQSSYDAHADFYYGHMKPRLEDGGSFLRRTQDAVFTLLTPVAGLRVCDLACGAGHLSRRLAAAGMIGFIGLVVPHLIRLVAGPDHRTLLPASMMAGAILLLLADLLARLALAPAELPIGIVTALIGAPFFLYLLLRGRA